MANDLGLNDKSDIFSGSQVSGGVIVFVETGVEIEGSLAAGI